MPVHSKPFAGRAKNAPPLVGPKPYQKPSQNGPQQAWVTPDSPVLRNFTYGPTNNDDSQNIANVQFSVIRRPAEKKPDKVPKSPQVVRFGAAEIFGGEKYEDVAYRRQVNQPDIVGECSSSAINQTTKSRGSSSSLSGAQALKECEVSVDNYVVYKDLVRIFICM
ncbi:uncharacterized protein LOC128555639 [Mercenaria mercenaria]|uniref:uncharacterized protein LOC128555639 n=1 Tax=Mercenaria mercenaria TaxID=6596 RepID=UPI00234F0A61|nr:uncharacterized protein LOC128555639 [Mercenaria mercenaria]